VLHYPSCNRVLQGKRESALIAPGCGAAVSPAEVEGKARALVHVPLGLRITDAAIDLDRLCMCRWAYGFRA